MSVSPDEGMMLLQQRMHRSDIQAPDTPEPGAEIGGELGIMVRLAAAIEANTATMRAAAAMARFDWEQCHPVELAGAQNGAAGVIDDPDRYGPRQGWVWQLMGWTVVLGSGTTSATVYEDSPNDPTNIAFSTTVSGRWEPSDYFILPGARFIWQSVGGGITLGKGKAIEIAVDTLPGYLGLRLSGRR